MKKYVRTTWSPKYVFEVVKANEYQTRIVVGRTYEINTFTGEIKHQDQTTNVLTKTIMKEADTLVELVDTFVAVYPDKSHLVESKIWDVEGDYEHLYGAIWTDTGLNYAIEYIDGEWRNLANER